MEYLRFFILFLAVSITCAAPASDESEDDEKVTITKEFYMEPFVVYKSSHDIVNILVPTNSFNFADDYDIEEADEIDNTTVIFFVEADIDAADKKDYKGLYVLKNGEATKILENGRSAAANSDDSTDVFFGASDGIYKYDRENNKAVKYGSVTDDIINIVKENGNDVIYYLNANHEIYKVSEGGEKREKMERLVGAQEIVLDPLNNLYFYDENKVPYVARDGSVKRIEGLPENPSFVKLIKPAFINEDSAVLLSDKTFYSIYANGSSELTDFEIEPKARPTAYAMEAAFIQFYGYNKQIYRYNLLSLLFGDLFKELKKFFDDKKTTIESISPLKKSKTRSKASH